MAYEKGHLVVEDFAVGIQSVNRASANNAALYSLWTAKHGFGVDGLDGARVFDVNVGRHNDIKISKSVLHATVVTTGDVVELSPEVSGGIIQSAPKRLGAGRWSFTVRTRQIYGAVAIVSAPSAITYRASCYIVRGADSTGLIVSTWDVPNAVRGDADFSLVVWAADDT